MNRVQFGEGACEKTRRYMDAYISNELLVETTHDLLRHLEGCPACAAELDSRTRLRARLKSAVHAQEVPRELPALVRERIRRHAAPWWAVPVLGPAATRWAMAAAAVLLMATGTWMTYTRPLALPGVADRPAQANYIQRVSASVVSIFKSGLGDHIHCAVFRKYPANPPAVERMEKELGPEYKGLLALVEPVVPAGYRVVLAHRCHYDGRLFVHLTMRKGTDVISLVVSKKEAGETMSGLAATADAHGVPVYQTSTDSYQIAGFESESYLAFVVSGLGKRKNLELRRRWLLVSAGCWRKAVTRVALSCVRVRGGCGYSRL